MEDKKTKRKKMMEELTRQDILESAIEIIEKSGEKLLTMDRVAERAGIAKGTVYLYYKNKQDLIDSVVDFSFLPLEEEWSGIIAEKKDALGTLKQCLAVSLDFVETHRPFLKNLKDYMFDVRKNHLTDPESWYWEAIRRFSGVLEDGVEAGSLRPMNCTKIATFYVDALDSMTTLRILNDIEGGVEDDVNEIMMLFSRGIAKE
ncbi:MAG: TetR/AcrR family transcriptional regulator [Desulfobacterales bacterium]|nr:TetR/AcrR family transcriptional regulator [Desulfobacterales bacterium]